ncbi:hypothetical protein N9H60_00710 [Flavimaricola sp.]|nr:hypothetical protein [Flavimaricola sp.]MDA9019688.1 hypothetical protein [Flavimaricola sp.]
MKRLTIAMLSLSLATPALANDPISLIGTWKGQEYGVGILDGWDQHDLIIEVSEQRGTAFKALKSYGTEGAYETQEVFGSMTPDGRTIVVVDHDGAFSGTLTSDDTMDLCYIETGDDASAKCSSLVRQQQ